MTTRAV